MELVRFKRPGSVFLLTRHTRLLNSECACVSNLSKKSYYGNSMHVDDDF